MKRGHFSAILLLVACILEASASQRGSLSVYGHYGYFNTTYQLNTDNFRYYGLYRFDYSGEDKTLRVAGACVGGGIDYYFSHAFAAGVELTRLSTTLTERGTGSDGFRVYEVERRVKADTYPAFLTFTRIFSWDHLRLSGKIGLGALVMRFSQYERYAGVVYGPNGDYIFNKEGVAGSLSLGLQYYLLERIGLFVEAGGFASGLEWEVTPGGERNLVSGLSAIGGLRLSRLPYAKRSGYYEKKIALGKEAYRAGELEKAIKLLGQAQKARPSEQTAEIIESWKGRLERRCERERREYARNRSEWRGCIRSGLLNAKLNGVLLGLDLSYRATSTYGCGILAEYWCWSSEEATSMTSSLYDFNTVAAYGQLHTRWSRVLAGIGAFKETYDVVYKAPYHVDYEDYVIEETNPGLVVGLGFRHGVAWDDTLGVETDILYFRVLGGNVTENGFMWSVGWSFGK